MYELNLKSHFLRKYSKLVKKNPLLDQRVKFTLDLLCMNPKDERLESHKVFSRRFGKLFSSVVTGDLRITWDYSNDMIRVLDIYDIGGHEGKGKVYR